MYHMLMAQYSLFVLKMPLNTNQPVSIIIARSAGTGPNLGGGRPVAKLAC